ncbi:TPA: hypothetical protein ACW7QV_003376 [Citrobacter braakii]|uniref:Holin n=1 Tax=Citrobacter braakii TaxID=57706 RepID=A0AAD1L201_CITBR|nr:hypothetical protein KAM621c_23930 [Citrobacter braakii]
MNNQSGGLVGGVITQFFAWLAALASAAGITFQDVFFILFGFAGVVISVASFVYGRFDARRKRNEDEARTKMLEAYLDGVSHKPVNERPAAVRVISEAMQKAGE